MSTRQHTGMLPKLSLFPAQIGLHSQQTLWYDKPAKDWMTEALPVGNGRLGAMFFGGIENERIQFNEESLWTGKPSVLAHGNGPKIFDAIHENIAAGRYSQAAKLAEKLRATDYGTPAYQEYQEKFGTNQTFGDVQIDFIHPEGTATGYRRELDISNAIGSVKYTIGDVNFHREIFSSFPDQVLILYLTANKPGRIHVRARFATPHPKTSTRTAASLLTLAGSLADNGMTFEAQLAVRTIGGTTTVTNEELEIAGADTVELVLSAATDYSQAAFSLHNGENPNGVNLRHISAALKKPYAELRTAHIRDYSELFARCQLSLTGPDLSHLPTDQRLSRLRKAPDPNLEALIFQYGRYLLIASSRPGTMPAHLQGIWNHSTNPPWSCDWHLDINLCMNYWPAQVTGLAECHTPLFGLMKLLQYQGKQVAKKAFNARGWFAAINTNPWGYSDNRWLCRSMAGWLVNHVWEYYQFTGDQEFLRDTAYPLMKEAALFLLDSLIEVDGHLLVGVSESPENYFKAPDDGKRYRLIYGVALDTQITWELFGNCVEAAEMLGVDADFAKELEQARKRLTPPRIGRWGQLQEWYHDFDDPDDNHRHASHLWAVFPGRQITPQDTPELAKAAAVSVHARGLKANGWAFPWRSAIYSRLRDPERAYHWLKGGMGYTTETRTIYDQGGGMYPNLLGASPPFQIDSNLGTTGAMAEMLLQSHRGAIELLPNLPAAWPAGSVTGLRARGGYSVDITWKDGKVTDYTIRSPEPREVEVRFGEKTGTIATSPPA